MTRHQRGSLGDEVHFLLLKCSDFSERSDDS